MTSDAEKGVLASPINDFGEWLAEPHVIDDAAQADERHHADDGENGHRHEQLEGRGVVELAFRVRDRRGQAVEERLAPGEPGSASSTSRNRSPRARPDA